MTSIKPLGNRVLVRRSKAKTSRGGILLPDSAQEKPREGVIAEVGPGKYNEETGKREPLTVKKGDRVLFSSYAGTEIKDLAGEDEESLILSEEDLLGILS